MKGEETKNGRDSLDPTLSDLDGIFETRFLLSGP
jgi:hypothetical protein